MNHSISDLTRSLTTYGRGDRTNLRAEIQVERFVSERISAKISEISASD